MYYCDNCKEPPRPNENVAFYECGHVLCSYCVKDGCPMCAMDEYIEKFNTGAISKSSSRSDNYGGYCIDKELK